LDSDRRVELFTACSRLAAMLLLLTVAEPVSADLSVASLDLVKRASGEGLSTDLTEDGGCRVKTRDEDKGRDACKERLLPRRPIPVLETPGSFFVGYAWGKKSKQFVYGPQVGLSGSILIPIRRPRLERGPDPSADEMLFHPPRSMSFTFDFALSLNANLAGFTFPYDEGNSSTNTQAGFNAGIYLGPQLGGAWWSDDGRGHRVAIVLGLLFGYLNTEATGSGVVLGFQPGLVAQF